MHQNAAVMHRWFEELWNQKREETIDALLSDDVVAHGLADGGTPLHGREGFRQVYRFYVGAFPDIKFHVDDVVAEGDLVATRFTITATHAGPNLGFAATNRPVTFGGMTLARVKDGKIVEGWNTVDLLGMLQQLGVAPKVSATIPLE